MPTPLDPADTLGAIVAARPESAAVFERFGLDYCCGGGATLADACAEHGVDVGEVRAAVDASSATHDHPARPDASIAELCEHIVVRRHGPLRVEMQRIASLLSTVVRVHGPGHPELAQLEDRFAGTRSDLLAHLRVEEESLFPACQALERDPATTFDTPLLDLLHDEHDDVGGQLREMREIAGGYDTEGAFCATHRSLLHALESFETNLHVHVHEENNILFPKVRERLGAAAR